MLGNFSCFCGRLLIFFLKFTFQNIPSETLSECHKVGTQFRTDILSDPIQVQIVWKGYQQNVHPHLDSNPLTLISIPEKVNFEKNLLTTTKGMKNYPACKVEKCPLT